MTPAEEYVSRDHVEAALTDAPRENANVPPFIVEHQSPLTAWGQVQRELRRSIDDGEFEAGSRIPAEVELMADFGVSRMTIRRAIGALEADGYLQARRGSGTYVTSRTDALRCDIDITLPWRDQLMAQGHQADSLLIEIQPDVPLSPALLKFVGHAIPESLTFGRHIEIVDGTPIALTESWVTSATRSGEISDQRLPVVTSVSIETGFATAEQAALLRSYIDTALIVTSSSSRLVTSGRQVEVARTYWLGTRVRFKSVQNLTLAHIDMSRLQAVGDHHDPR